VVNMSAGQLASVQCVCTRVRGYYAGLTQV
jgi:hypothetical protein